MSLTPKQEKYVQGLFKGLSQRQAYKEAGYTHLGKTDGYIDKLAHELAKESKISGRLTELQEQQTKESKWTIDRLIEEFVAVKEKCMQEVPVLDKLGNETGEYTFKETGVIKSLENIGKLLGHYTEKIQSTNTNLNQDLTNMDETERRKRLEELIKKMS